MGRQWRQDSEFGEGERVALDREQRAVIRARLHMKAHRGPGRLTANAVAIGERLLGMLGPKGALFPAVATLAKLQGISASTVSLALKRLKQGGFLNWTRRLVRVGNRVRQTSNAYAFRCDIGTRQPVLFPLILSVPLMERDARARAESGSPAPSQALLAVRERRNAALAAQWQARRTRPV
jgi:hypothetical protein